MPSIGFRAFIVAVVILIGACALPRSASLATEFSTTSVSAHDRELYSAAFAATQARRWQTARRLVGDGADPLVAMIIDWLYFTQPGRTGTFDEISRFIDENPDWPRRKALQKSAEAGLTDRTSDLRVMSWFARHPPLTGIGKQRFAEAHLRAGSTWQGISLLREAWINDNFTRRQERTFLRRHRRHLTKEHHAARLDRLIWERRRGAAHRMLSRVNEAHKRLGYARLSLIEFAGGVDRAIARVPPALQDHPGLAYERVVWRRIKGKHANAREILLNPPLALGRPDKWWSERHIQIRRVLRLGHISEAYQLAEQHGQMKRAGIAEAEWLAGWIALTFLADYDAAYGHFTLAYRVVRYPISLARGAYWSGRAADAKGEIRLARHWYDVAAGHPTTFYGQLAALKLHDQSLFRLPSDPVPTIAEAERFRDRELVKVVRWLAALGQRDLIRPFLMRLGELAPSPGEQVLVGVLAKSVNRPDLAVAAAKRAEREGIMLARANYPVIELPVFATAESALLLAITRQESAFDPAAVSPAGARGLMQLMPRTACHVAKRLRLPYNKRKLTSDPDYNATLGSAHVAELLEAYDDSYVLTLAAYNAGSRNVSRWIRAWGDPRKGEIDIIHWIELIPISETRNYVQRVLEGLQLYRYRLNGHVMRLALADDLVRGQGPLDGTECERAAAKLAALC